jgi:hypothetical protein
MPARSSSFSGRSAAARMSDLRRMNTAKSYIPMRWSTPDGIA